MSSPVRHPGGGREGHSPEVRAHLTGAPVAVHRPELVDPLADGRWEAFVAREPGATVFHHRAYLDLLKRAHGYPMTACCLVDASGAIEAGVPFALVSRWPRQPRLVSLPFTDRCAPLPAPGDQPVLAHHLAEAVDGLRRSTSTCAELRGPVAAHGSARVSSVHVEHEIPLGGPVAEPLEQAAGAAAAGLRVERRTDMGALKEFRRLYAASRRRHGVPVHSRRVLAGLAHMFDRGLGFVLRVVDGARVVAGGVFLTFNGVLTCHCTATGRFVRDRAPLDLALLEAIRWGSSAGMHTLALGRTDLDDEERRRLRRSWGAQERLLEYHEFSGGAQPGRALAGEAT